MTGQMHALLLESDVCLARLYGAGLRAAGYTVSVAHHAQDAVALADDRRPDVLVVDMQLGGHGGMEFLYEFRSYVDWREVPALLLSAAPPHALQLSRQQQQRLGIADCLYKPATTVQALSRALNDVCRP
ncbi:hypothetical protein CR970_03685 [Candidatus Saccharibacteria bacterium]|nr:MAG: hypothetical protein CR970_03685 [Candidatus Saccharibacteria bacterium]